ncbi:MAG: NAD(P)/FAD-dependent oxidoreductase [Treponema sp.]|nr:NAD(P)/FAD-dependent oxidoreductase [Treponema sp.]
MKSVAIIGAGIAGLAAGTYLQSSGFDVTIYEQHLIPGGLSTSWSRKGYLFEGGMHWLTGSSPKLALNKVWKEVGALKENNPIYNRDPIYTLIRGQKQLRLFRDVEKLREEFLAWSPEDRPAINRLCSHIKKFRNVHLLVNDVPGLKTKSHTRASLKELLAMVPAGIPTLLLSKKSYIDYVAQFKNEDIRHLLLAVIGTRYNALSFVYTLGSFASGDSGYPEGGSLRLTQNMADTFTSLGGKIVYRAKVEKVAEKNGKACGIYLSKKNSSSSNTPSSLNTTSDNFNNSDTGEFVPAEYILVSQDTRSAIENLFENPPKDAWISKMKKIVKTEQNMFVCLGVKANLSNYPRCFVLPLEKEFFAAGLSFGELRINNYAEYKNHSPENCTSLTCLLLGDSYKWWKEKKERGTYKEEKDKLVKNFTEVVEKYVPEVKGNVEVTDIATPLTYERYCSSFEGSWMSVWDTEASMFTFPAKCTSISNLYFAGERMMMPGGLPIAVWSGRRAAQTICKDSGTIFTPPNV